MPLHEYQTLLPTKYGNVMNEDEFDLWLHKYGYVTEFYELRTLVSDKIKFVRNRIQEHSKYKLPNPIHTYFLDLGDCYGACVKNEKVILINPFHLLYISEKIIDEIIPHELAHLLVDIYYLGSGGIHNTYWQEMCLAICGVLLDPHPVINPGKELIRVQLENRHTQLDIHYDIGYSL